MKKRKAKKAKPTREEQGNDHDELAIALADFTPDRFELLQRLNEQQAAKGAAGDVSRRRAAVVQGQRGWVKAAGKSWFWCYRDVAGENGDRPQRAMRMCSLDEMTYEQARAAADAIADAILPLAIAPGTACSWVNWADRFVAVYLPSLRHSSRPVVGSVIRKHLRKAFKGRALHEIRAAHIQTWIARMNAAGAATDSVSLRFSVLRKMLRFARREGFTVEIPAAGAVDLPRADSVEATAPPPFSGDDLERLLAEAPEPLYTIILLCSLTGLRIGEALGLRFEDLDLEAGRMQLSRQFTRGRVTRPKTRSSAAEHRLPPELCAHMLTYAGSGQPSGFLFPSPRLPEKPMTEACVRNHLNALLEQLGIKLPGQAFHALRKYFGTQGARAGIALSALQKAMRHSDSRSTSRYIRMGTEDADAAVDRVAADYFRGKRPKVVMLPRRNGKKRPKTPET